MSNIANLLSQLGISSHSLGMLSGNFQNRGDQLNALLGPSLGAVPQGITGGAPVQVPGFAQGLQNISERIRAAATPIASDIARPPFVFGPQAGSFNPFPREGDRSAIDPSMLRGLR